MKKQLVTFASAALLGLAAHTAHASVVLTNLDPANSPLSLSEPVIGEALQISNRPISLTSVLFSQTGGLATGETFAVYSRNTDGTVGSSLFGNFTLTYDAVAKDTTAATSGAFTLQANTGYFFVLRSANGTSNVEWDFTTSTDYASAFGVTIPTNNATFYSNNNVPFYFPLNGGPQLFQVNGTALAAVPEPSTWAFMGLALAGGATMLARRRAARVA